jgi:putative flippase GtrA
MRHFLQRTSRYAQVGLLCALLNNAIVIGLDRLGHDYVISVAAAFFVSTCIGYVLHTSYTFNVVASRGSGLRFAAANLSAFPLSMGTMFILCGVLGIAAWIAMPIATMLLFACNYLLAHLALARPVREGS